MNREIFDRLYDSGVLDSARAEYLWLPEMNFFPPVAGGGEYCGLTAFAMTGKNDLFCWDDDDRVYLAPPDHTEPVLYAANFRDAIYRRLLEFASDAFGTFCSDEEKAAMPHEAAEAVISHSEALAMLKEYEGGFEALLLPEQLDVLRTLRRGGFDKSGVLLTESACGALIGVLLDAAG